ncbi:MAG: hypothetical protein OES84_04025 [Kiritimatiellaceae bacterium]|nr:hypothetical protein [Kiritimatiellaceae bacterium]
MESEQLIELIKESILLEENVADLYKVFSLNIPEDSNFWWQFHLEERSHSMLLHMAKDSFVQHGVFPKDLLTNSIDALKDSNVRIEKLIEECNAKTPTRREACMMAIALENEAGEQHYMKFMEKSAESSLEAVFQQLNRDDKEHERRIREHLDALPAEA